jgi:hypothetical protein
MHTVKLLVKVPRYAAIVTLAAGMPNKLNARCITAGCYTTNTRETNKVQLLHGKQTREEIFAFLPKTQFAEIKTTTHFYYGTD